MYLFACLCINMIAPEPLEISQNFQCTIIQSKGRTSSKMTKYGCAGAGAGGDLMRLMF